MERVKFFFQRIYRVSLSYPRQEVLVWQDLKKLHLQADWRHGIFEREKTLETTFEINEGVDATFRYMIHGSFLHSRVRVLEDFPAEMATEFFILATHFNNLLQSGVVIVDAHARNIEYSDKKELLVHLLYNGEIYNQITQHYNISTDLYSAFQRLLLEQESPAIIIADFLKSKERRNQDPPQPS